MTNSQSKIPQLRFPEFTDEWKDYTYTQIYKNVVTNSLSRSQLNYNKGIIKNIHYGDIHTKLKPLFDSSKENIPFINSEYENTKCTFVKNGDLIITDASENYNDIGKSIEIANTNNDKIVAGLHTIHAQRINDKIELNFGCYLMQSHFIKEQIKKIAQGTKVLGISKNTLNKIQLYLPHQSEEQEKIASFLIAIDKRIELLTAQKEQLEIYKKGLMQKLFSREIRFKDENGNTFPDWKEKKLSSISTIKKGKQLNKQHLTNKGKYPAINGGVMPSGYTNTFNTNGNTITISEGGNSCGYISFQNKDFWAGGHCYYLNELKINSIFLYQILKHKEKKIMNLRVGSGLPNIQKKDIENVKLPIPNNTTELNNISIILKKLDKKISSIAVSTFLAITYKKGLLQKLFI